MHFQSPPNKHKKYYYYAGKKESKKFREDAGKYILTQEYNKLGIY